MKVIYRILLVITTFILIVSSFENLSFAYDWRGKIDSAYQSSNDYKTTEIATSTTNIMGSIITTIKVIATGVAVMILIVLAMKYMMASAGDKAEIKKHAVVYVVGAVVLFATTGILTIIDNFAGAI